MVYYLIAVVVSFLFGLYYLNEIRKAGLTRWNFDWVEFLCDASIFAVLVVMLFPFPLIILCDNHEPSARFVEGLLDLEYKE